jgi:hypothetical protein
LEWITLAAIIVGPVLALLVQRILDHLRQDKRQRLELYLTLMGTRGAPVSPQHVNALNSVPVVFNKRRHTKIRTALQTLLQHTGAPRAAAPAKWDERYADLKADLLQAMGADVGYNFTVDDVKRQLYAPMGHIEAELDLLQIRQAPTKIITDEGVQVVLEQPDSLGTRHVMKMESVRKLFGGRYDIRSKEFLEAMNEIMLVFSDSQEVMAAMQEFYTYQTSQQQLGRRPSLTPGVSEDKLIKLMKAICRDLRITYTNLPDAYFLRTFSVPPQA